jgi:DNA-binding CsgD family transcriptional regulator
MTNFDSLVDKIYEAATDPSLWPEAMHGLGRAVDGAHAFILTRRSDSWVGWRSSSEMGSIAAYLNSSAEQRSQATSRLLAMNRAGFVDALEVFSAEEYLADPLVTDWAGPAGLHHAAATAIHVPTGDMVLVQVNRKIGEPHFGKDALARLDAFRPHLARAGLLAARWRLERLRAATEALALIGLPAAVLGVDGKVLTANELIQNLRSHVMWLSKDRIAFAHGRANDRLKRALAELSINGGCSLPARSASKAPVVVHLIPATGTARDLFGGGLSLLAITPLAAPKAPDAAIIRGLFDLTPAEAQVAIAVAEGLTLEEIATRRGVAVETVRTQVKSLFAKTGVGRQSQLASLLAAQIAMPLE